ncbi:MAG: hypothetical protein U5O39_10800 [Gammaproteobacteria bacterium]|nr:hypothetical protein [Gammaproteobacteria bacterium]
MVTLGTGVMIGAGIFALTGQMAEMTGALLLLAFRDSIHSAKSRAYVARDYLSVYFPRIQM